MKNEDLETAERQNRFLVYGTAGPDKIKVRGSIGIAPPWTMITFGLIVSVRKSKGACILPLATRPDAPREGTA
jgi:hypothetical protein